MPRKILAAVAFLSAGLWAVTPVMAQQAQPPRAQANQPTRINSFQSWTAAHTQEGGQKVCYAFTRAGRSEGAPPNRQAVTLTVTHRPGGRDQVAVSAGYPYARQAEAVLNVGATEFKSYGTVGSNAFFQNGAQMVAAFRNGRDAVVKSPGPPGRGTVTDSFPLAGFAQAYEAISRECPAPRPAGR